jgi:lysophospholipase L1-like esterase
VRFLALGDSYTIGEAVRPDERWPVLLAGLLRDRGVAIDDPDIIATTGWTTDELMDGIDAAAPDGPFDLVTLLVGVNDQYRGRDLAEYRQRFTVLLDRAVGLAAGRPDHVIVLSIPDWGVTPFAAGRDRAQIAAEIDGFNAVNRAEAERIGTPYIDITEFSRRAIDAPDLIADDGLHPSGAMYAGWTRMVLPVALAALMPEK